MKNNVLIFRQGRKLSQSVKRLFRRDFLKPFTFLFVILCLVEWSGFPFFAFYLVEFLKVNTLWFQLEDTVLLIGTTQLY